MKLLTTIGASVTVVVLITIFGTLALVGWVIFGKWRT